MAVGDKQVTLGIHTSTRDGTLTDKASLGHAWITVEKRGLL